jgi:hypothetical protein
MAENESTSVTTRSVGLKYGVISTVIGLLTFLLPSFLGMNPFDTTWNTIGLVVTVVIIVFAHREFKIEGNNFMSYGQGMGIVFWIALVSTIIVAVISYVYVEMIDTSVMDLYYETQREGMEKGGMPESQIETSLEWTRKLFWPIYVFVGIVGSLVIGLIVTIFTQKKPPESMY